MAFTSDYLKIYESELTRDFENFSSNCQTFLNGVDKIIQPVFNDCKKQNKIDDCSMESNCKELLSEMQSFKRLCENLKNQLKNEKIKEENSEKIDPEIFGLDVKDQNEILIDRVMNLQNSKKLAEKYLKELYEKFSLYQNHEYEALLESKTIENSVTSLKSQQKNIEREVNAEVQRIKYQFAKAYMERLKIKNKYDKNDLKMRTQIMPKLKHLQDSISSSKNELENIQQEIFDLKEFLKIEENYEMEFSEKLEFLERDFTHKLQEVSKVEDEIKHMQKRISKINELIKKQKDDTNDKNQDLKESNHVCQRVNDILHDDLNDELDKVEEKTWHDYNQKKKIIETLKRKICQVSHAICNSEVVKDQLKNDLDYLMAREGKFIFGVDHAGGNFIKVNK